jgi:hypothetical protein
MTGTPLDLTPFGALLKGIGVIYWMLAAVGLWFALRGSAPWRVKLLRATPVVLLFGFIPGRMGGEEFQARRRLNTAMTLFQERCKSAGEKVDRIVENVDGIVWMRWRPSHVKSGDQFELDDPYGRDCGGEDCIGTYLFDYAMVPSGAGGLSPSNKRLFRYVDSIDPVAGERYRYTKASPSATLSKQKPASSDTPRYGVTWEDISTREDREHWIAGGALKIIDLQTQDVIAERIGYLLDPGQGSTAGFRDPWSWARSYTRACPPIAQHNHAFVAKVLKPTRQGE